MLLFLFLYCGVVYFDVYLVYVIDCFERLFISGIFTLIRMQV